MKRETWFAEDSENDASQDGDSDSNKDAARDGEEHSSLQNYRIQWETDLKWSNAPQSEL